MERRLHRRVRAHIKSLLLANAQEQEMEGKVVDLSLGGAKFESPLIATPGKQVTVKFVVPGASTPIYIEHAEIRWVHDRAFGVKFLEIRPNQLDELEQLIDEYVAADAQPESNNRSDP